MTIWKQLHKIEGPFRFWKSTYEFEIHFEMTQFQKSHTATLMFFLFHLENCILTTLFALSEPHTIGNHDFIIIFLVIFMNLKFILKWPNFKITYYHFDIDDPPLLQELHFRHSIHPKWTPYNWKSWFYFIFSHF